MKKLLLFVAVASAFSFASCKKDHTCTCTTTFADGTPSYTTTGTLIKSTKMNAKKQCINSMTGTGTDLQTTTCELK